MKLGWPCRTTEVLAQSGARSSNASQAGGFDEYIRNIQMQETGMSFLGRIIKYRE